MASRDEVAEFLFEWKAAARRRLNFVPRQKNIDGCKQLGITVTMAKQMLLSLTVAEYVKGPEPDHDGRGDLVWFFGKKVNEHEVYIKIKVYEVQGVSYAKCFGFHPAEWPLQFPLRRR